MSARPRKLWRGVHRHGDLQLDGTGAVPDAVRGRIFTLLDMTCSSMRLLSVALAMVLVDALDIAPRYWVGGTLLALADFLGLVFSVQHDLREDEPVATGKGNRGGSSQPRSNSPCTNASRPSARFRPRLPSFTAAFGPRSR